MARRSPNRRRSIEDEPNKGITRREAIFYGLGAFTTLGVEYATTGLSGKLAYAIQELLTDESALVENKELYQEAKRLEERYSCTINLKRVTEASVEEIEEVLTVLKKTLSKYPQDFIQRMELTFHFRHEIEACIDEEDIPEDVELEANGGSTGRGDILLHLSHLIEGGEGILYHEVHHEAKVKYGTKYETFCEWVDLNPEKAEAYMEKEWIQHLAEARPKGFTNHYSRYKPKEDQAELARSLFDAPNRTLVLALRDQVVAKKLSKLKGYYKKWSEGKMNAQYWQDLADSKVNEEYWDNRV